MATKYLITEEQKKQLEQKLNKPQIFEYIFEGKKYKLPSGLVDDLITEIKNEQRNLDETLLEEEFKLYFEETKKGLLRENQQKYGNLVNEIDFNTLKDKFKNTYKGAFNSTSIKDERIAELQNQVSQLENENADLRSQVVELESKLSKYTSGLEAGRKKKADINKTKSMKSTAKKAIDTIKSLEDFLNKYEGFLNKYPDLGLGDYRTKIKSAKSMLHDGLDEIDITKIEKSIRVAEQVKEFIKTHLNKIKGVGSSKLAAQGQQMIGSRAIDENTEVSSDYLPITTPINSEDAKLFKSVINKDIDSHLEGFTKSTFEEKNGRLIMRFDMSEIPTLVRRLRDVGTIEADMWADDIENYKPGELDEALHGYGNAAGQSGGAGTKTVGKIMTKIGSIFGSPVDKLHTVLDSKVEANEITQQDSKRIFDILYPEVKSKKIASSDIESAVQNAISQYITQSVNEETTDSNLQGNEEVELLSKALIKTIKFDSKSDLYILNPLDFFKYLIQNSNNDKIETNFLEKFFQSITKDYSFYNIKTGFYQISKEKWEANFGVGQMVLTKLNNRINDIINKDTTINEESFDSLDDSSSKKMAMALLESIHNDSKNNRFYIVLDELKNRVGNSYFNILIKFLIKDKKFVYDKSRNLVTIKYDDWKNAGYSDSQTLSLAIKRVLNTKNPIDNNSTVEFFDSQIVETLKVVNDSVKKNIKFDNAKNEYVLDAKKVYEYIKNNISENEYKDVKYKVNTFLLNIFDDYNNYIDVYRMSKDKWDKNDLDKNFIYIYSKWFYGTKKKLPELNETTTQNYKFYVIDTTNNEAVTGFESKEDALDVAKDKNTTDKSKRFKVASATWFKKHGKNLDSFNESKDPCWSGYEMVGMKKKGKKDVPNCVPKK